MSIEGVIPAMLRESAAVPISPAPIAWEVRLVTG